MVYVLRARAFVGKKFIAGLQIIRKWKHEDFPHPEWLHQPAKLREWLSHVTINGKPLEREHNGVKICYDLYRWGGNPPRVVYFPGYDEKGKEYPPNYGQLLPL